MCIFNLTSITSPSKGLLLFLSHFCHCLVLCLVTKSCLTLWDPMDCSSPGSSNSWISQARILNWVASSFSRGPSWSRDWTCICCIEDGFFTTKPPGKPFFLIIKSNMILLNIFSCDSFFNLKCRVSLHINTSLFMESSYNMSWHFRKKFKESTNTYFFPFMRYCVRCQVIPMKCL